MRVLFDTGTISTIVLQKFTTKKYTSTFKTKPIKWNTLGGAFYTRKKALIKFKLLEFSTHKEISWSVHVDTHTKPKHAQYDMIMGTDFMKELGINISFLNQVICWEDDTIPMKQKGILSDVYQILTDTPTLEMSEDKQKSDSFAEDLEEKDESMVSSSSSLSRDKGFLIKSANRRPLSNNFALVYQRHAVTEILHFQHVMA